MMKRRNQTMPDGFYNINNEYITKETIINDLISYYNDLYEANATKITDFNEGSEIRNLLEVMSVLAYNILEEQNETLKNHFINTAEGEYLDLLGANPNVNLEREQGNAATGLVKFTYPAPATSEITIPTNTTVSCTTNGLDYLTTSEGYISTGETYTYVPVECEYSGADGNIGVNEIDTCEYAQFTVTNEESFIDGVDYEEDEEYRQRLLNFVQADNFGSIGYYENVILNTENVHDISLQQQDTTLNFIINCNTDRDVAQSTLLDVIDHFNDNNNRVVGHTLNISLSNIHTISFDITVPTDCGYSEETIKNFFNCYFKGGALSEFPLFYNGLNINEEVSNESLISELTSNLTDISTATISNISNSINDQESTSFDFIVSQNGSYFINNINVVFE